ncbi:MAG: formate dehydrogenase family accessory protein FdhD [Nitrospira bacterium SG8_3]|nr:MAG: formate dehydrogenase family accessory protein FdhD [Nitrospira bacterium SG8_3]
MHHVLCCQDGTFQAYEQELVEEEPLLIRVEGNSYSVVMRTPGEENFHAAGFCLAEGLVDEPEDIETIGYCDQMDSSVVLVTLQPARRKKVEDLLQRRGFVSQTSCGICGKEMIRDLCQILAPVTDKMKINVRQALECANELPRHQRLYKITHGSHAAMIFDGELHVLAVSEDVGRHNALDKAIGKVFLGRKLQNARLAVLSSRISYELVQKAARAHLPILISLSRPTALAVELGRTLNMTLACLSREGGLCVFCGEEALLEG